jgi:transposase-like protein
MSAVSLKENCIRRWRISEMNCNCDSCKQDFVIGRLDERLLKDGVRQTFFSCPHCKKEYTAFYTDKAIRERQKELKNLQSECKRTKKPERLEELSEQIERITMENDVAMSRLRQEHEAEET